MSELEAELLAKAASEDAPMAPDMVQAWFDEPGQVGQTPRDFWPQVLKDTNHKFYRLGVVARSVYSTMVATALPETDFSILKILVEPRRSSMKPEQISRSMALRLNRDFWFPVPELKNDKFLIEFMEKVGADWGIENDMSDDESD